MTALQLWNYSSSRSNAVGSNLISHLLHILLVTFRQIVLELEGTADHCAASANLFCLYMQLFAVKVRWMQLQLPKGKSHNVTRTRAHLELDAASCKIFCFYEAFAPVINLVQS